MSIIAISSYVFAIFFGIFIQKSRIVDGVTFMFYYVWNKFGLVLRQNLFMNETW